MNELQKPEQVQERIDIRKLTRFLTFWPAVNFLVAALGTGAAVWSSYIAKRALEESTKGLREQNDAKRPYFVLSGGKGTITDGLFSVGLANKGDRPASKVTLTIENVVDGSTKITKGAAALDSTFEYSSTPVSRAEEVILENEIPAQGEEEFELIQSGASHRTFTVRVSYQDAIDSDRFEQTFRMVCSNTSQPGEKLNTFNVTPAKGVRIIRPGKSEKGLVKPVQ